jgi:hypothetical protein
VKKLNKMPRELLKGPLQKAKPKKMSEVREIGNSVVVNTTMDKVPTGESSCLMYYLMPESMLRYRLVTVFDSSKVPEPFLDTVLLEKLKKRRREESAKSQESKVS